EMAARRLGASNPCAVGVTRLGSPGPSASPVTKIVAGTRRASMSSIVGRAARSARDRAGRVTTESRGKSKDANTECSFRCRDTTSLGEVLVLFPYIANHPGNGQQKTRPSRILGLNPHRLRLIDPRGPGSRSRVALEGSDQGGLRIRPTD